MLCYNLTDNIDGEKLINNINKLIQKGTQPGKEFLLVIKLQEITSSDDSNIPKLTFES